MGCGQSHQSQMHVASVDLQSVAISKKFRLASNDSTASTATPSDISSEVPTSSASLLERYSFGSGDKKVLGKGSSSVCFLGTDLVTGESVAIKVYKSPKDSGALERYRRQVAVLLELQEPFRRPADKTLWTEELAGVQPSDLFVRLLDYSKDASGKPGYDPADGSMYVVTELAQHTLRDELRDRRDSNRPLSAKEALAYTKEIVLAVAGLHAKGFVHSDIKPDNIMRCGGRWKLIDMDGCARLGTKIRAGDDSVSFSPCYCAPEFARLVVDGGKMKASSLMDAWSVGITLAELIRGQPLLRSVIVQAEKQHGPQLARLEFLRWLGSVDAMPQPRPTRPEHAALSEFLWKNLIVPKKSRRKTLAESLSAPYFASDKSIGLDL